MELNGRLVRSHHTLFHGHGGPSSIALNSTNNSANAMCELRGAVHSIVRLISSSQVSSPAVLHSSGSATVAMARFCNAIFIAAICLDASFSAGVSWAPSKCAALATTSCRYFARAAVCMALIRLIASSRRVLKLDSSLSSLDLSSSSKALATS